MKYEVGSKIAFLSGLAGQQPYLTRGKTAIAVWDQFWVVVIESKQAGFSLEVGKSQLLTYMLANPHPDRPSYGLLTNGNSFLFIKLMQQEPPQYILSRLFYIFNPGNDLYHVLRVLKRLAQLAV